MNDKDFDIPDDEQEYAPELPPELSRLMVVDRIKGDYFDLTIEATNEELRDLAKRFDLVELKYLTAILVLTPTRSKPTFHLKATFEASVVQRCVVTLEPVPSDLKGAFECDYAQEIEAEDIDVVEFDEMTEDPPEPIVNGEFDLGIMLTEQFGLELNPFPRATGADFDEVRDATNGKLEDKDSNNPFAVLKNLK
jgi:uncharacterized metal-binding protein YceD (DUF177 family)